LLAIASVIHVPPNPIALGAVADVFSSQYHSFFPPYLSTLSATHPRVRRFFAHFPLFGRFHNFRPHQLPLACYYAGREMNTYYDLIVDEKYRLIGRAKFDGAVWAQQKYHDIQTKTKANRSTRDSSFLTKYPSFASLATSINVNFITLIPTEHHFKRRIVGVIQLLSPPNKRGNVIL
jgi:hypothetical protein